MLDPRIRLQGGAPNEHLPQIRRPPALPHYVSTRRSIRDSIEQMTDEQKALFEASQLRADVVEVPAPPAGADLRRSSSGMLYFDRS